MNKKYLLILVLVFLGYHGLAQKKKSYKIHTVAFYNVENLFDTINNPDTFDDDRTPTGKDRWTSKVYDKKIANMAKAIAEIGKDVAKTAPTLVGVAEIENELVLQDLIKTPELIDKNYGIVHFESPDRRGIDVALLYQKKYFTPTSFDNLELLIFDDEDGKRVYTRDQLLVTGELEGEEIHVIVNHWPSRFGGEARSRPKRIAAAKLNKKIIDSLQARDPEAKIITMGDFNDNPNNDSFKKVLKTEAKRNRAKGTDLYNPMEQMFKKGMGSNAYRDVWSLFDQVIVSASLLEKDYSSFRFYKAGILNKRFLINPKGRYKGYPFRSFADGHFTDGYSDHFPAYIYLIKEVE
ncbi:endonuclease/exonuclease/phosphatase family protein [Sungkyunkwania multivorans]